MVLISFPEVLTEIGTPAEASRVSTAWAVTARARAAGACPLCTWLTPPVGTMEPVRTVLSSRAILARSGTSSTVRDSPASRG